MTLHVVTMHRWGDREKHSYVLGVYDDYDTAVLAGMKEHDERGHKYEPTIWSMLPNSDHCIKIEDPCRPKSGAW